MTGTQKKITPDFAHRMNANKYHNLGWLNRCGVCSPGVSKKEIYQDLVNIEIEHTNYLERPEWQAKNEEYLKVCREKSN